MTIKDIIKLLPANEPQPQLPKRKTKKAMGAYMFACGRYAGFGNCLHYTISALSKITIPEMATKEEIRKILDGYMYDNFFQRSHNWSISWELWEKKIRDEIVDSLLTKIPKPEGKGLLQQKYVARCKELEAKVSEYRMALETLLELAMSCKRAGLKDMKIDGVIDIVTKGE